MKNPVSTRFAAIVVIAVAGLVFACKKDNSNSGNSNQTTVSTQADDQSMISDESDNLANDADASLSSESSINGNAARQSRISDVTVMSTEKTHADSAGVIVNSSLICDATVAIDTASDPRTITITYNGTNCWGNRTRTGTIIVSIAAGVHWEDAGAQVSIVIENLKITRLRDNKSITFNGVRTMTNVSGGNLVDLANVGTITHSLSDSMRITFDNNSTRSWQVAKQRVFTYDNGIVVTTTGTHSDGDISGIAEWGQNRFGTTFESLITEPKVIRQDCDFRLVSGQNEILRSDSLNSVITYGLDASGNATSCPGSGNYYFEIVWSFPNGKTIPIILPY